MRDLLRRLCCPLCGGTRESSLLVVVDGPVEAARVRAQCARCHLFWSFALEGAGAEPVPPEPRRAPAAAGPITADEVLELHHLLDRCDGSLSDLVWRRAS